MKQKGFAPVLIILVIVVIGVLGYFSFRYFQTTTQSLNLPTTAPATLPTNTPTSTPSASPASQIPAGWQTYTNSQYWFEISFPANFKALTDSTNLYGWPDAIALIYSGGQSYDLPIEVWNTEAQYKEKYSALKYPPTAFKTKDGKFITLTNINNDPTVTQIMATFKFTQ
jgi:hypothetical protein